MIEAAQCGVERQWWGLYRRDYDLVTAESMAHPAKMAWGLAFRILEHLEEMGMLKPGATVLDPMAGTGRVLLAACAKGFKAVGIELEPKFVTMCQANREYAGRKLGRELDWEIIQGDARHLSRLLGERGLVAVSSPPYSDITIKDGQRLASKPDIHWAEWDRGTGYGDTPGQIGQLPDKPLVVTSPPYGEAQKGGGISARKRGEGTYPLTTTLPGNIYQPSEAGSSPGQIGVLPDRPLTVITSPPYEDSSMAGGFRPPHDSVGFTEQGYGESEGQIGQLQSPNYLSEMRKIYAEIAKVADVLVVVVKNPTRQGKLRRLDLDTIALLEATGWRIHCVHQAMLFEETEQGHLFDGSQKRVKGRMSFFKRLAYQKGAIVAQWEDVIVMVK